MTEPKYTNMSRDHPHGRIVRLVSGIANFIGFPFWGAVAALVTGYAAKAEIQKSNGRVGGERLAKAGLILGWVGLGLGLLVICLSVLMFLGFFGGIAFCGPLSELINSAR